MDGDENKVANFEIIVEIFENGFVPKSGYLLFMSFRCSILAWLSDLPVPVRSTMGFRKVGGEDLLVPTLLCRDIQQDDLQPIVTLQTEISRRPPLRALTVDI